MNWQNSKTSDIGHLRHTTFYPPTGTGRDSYIMTNNGGTSASTKLQGVATHGNYMKFGRVYSTNKPVSMDRHKRYVSDGTGRDAYITSNWDSHGTVSEKVKLFKTTFRDGNMFRTSTSAWGSRKNPEQQHNHMRRLSTPKKREDKYLVKMDELKRKLKVAE